MLCPDRWIVPQTFLLQPGGCLFIGGLARLDYISVCSIHCFYFKALHTERRSVKIHVANLIKDLNFALITFLQIFEQNCRFSKFAIFTHLTQQQ